MSIVFPLITGIVLGVSLLLWRLVLAAYTNHLSRLVRLSLKAFNSEQHFSEEKNNDCDKSSLGYKLRAGLAAALHMIQ